MQITSDIKPVTYLKSRVDDVLNMKNPISLLKLLSFAEEDIKNGNLLDEEDVFASVDELLKSKKE